MMLVRRLVCMLIIKASTSCTLPGVPKEMEFIFEHEMGSKLRTLLDRQDETYELGYYFSGIPESFLEEELEKTGIRLYPYADIGIAYNVFFPQIDVTLSVKPKINAPSIESIRQDLEALMMQRLEPYFLSRSNESIEENILTVLNQRGWKLGVAESMTGGLHVRA